MSRELLSPEKLSELLDTQIQESDIGQVTVREYLHRLLDDVWTKEESFNSKRPFGNSSWQYEVFFALFDAGVIDGEKDDDFGDAVDDEQGLFVTRQLIAHMCGVPFVA